MRADSAIQVSHSKLRSQGLPYDQLEAWALGESDDILDRAQNGAETVFSLARSDTRSDEDSVVERRSEVSAPPPCRQPLTSQKTLFMP